MIKKIRTEESSNGTMNLIRKSHTKRTKKDLVDAVKQYRYEAEQGNAEAQYLLGCCYQFGDGIAKNRDEAPKWFRKSAKQGYVQAQELLELIKLKLKAKSRR
ncbi:MAG: tetratricopeptide repeat protein [Victivallaceae bacterium]